MCSILSWDQAMYYTLVGGWIPVKHGVTKFFKTRNFFVSDRFLFFGLNMFLVPVKLRSFKFSPYLILIVFLIPTKKFCTQC